MSLDGSQPSPENKLIEVYESFLNGGSIHKGAEKDQDALEKMHQKQGIGAHREVGTQDILKVVSGDKGAELNNRGVEFSNH